MGDALTVALMNVRGFQPENFARFHPGGSLGRRLLSKVRDEMISNSVPLIHHNAGFTEVINTISGSGLGLTLVELITGKLGIITDGDLRRAINIKGKLAFDLIACDIATPNPTCISVESNIQIAYELMERKGITSLVVVDGESIAGILKK